MSVMRYLVCLYLGSSRKAERERSLSLANEEYLRDLLEDMVAGYVGERKMRNTDLSRGWQLRIHNLTRDGKARGRAIRRVSISRGGETVVTR